METCDPVGSKATMRSSIVVLLSEEDVGRKMYLMLMLVHGPENDADLTRSPQRVSHHDALANHYSNLSDARSR